LAFPKAAPTEREQAPALQTFAAISPRAQLAPYVRVVRDAWHHTSKSGTFSRSVFKA
jgi:hypothetical protein